MTVQSLEFTRELLRERSGVVPVFLLTLEAPGFPVARLARAPYRVISRGLRFEKSWFGIEFADEKSDELGEYKVMIGNVDRRMVETIRSITEPVPATLEMVTNRDFDRLEMRPIRVEALSKRITPTKIEIPLGRDSVHKETVPHGTYNPRDDPGVFA